MEPDLGVIIDVDTVPPTTNAIYRAIGHAMVCWQDVETALCIIFSKVSTCRHMEICNAIFFTAHDFSVKSDMTRNALRLYLANDERLMDDFTKLRSRMKKLGTTRNGLAHFVKVFVRTPDGPVIKLKPNSQDPNIPFKDTSNTPPTMGIHEITKAIQDFQKLTKDLQDFSHRIPPPEEPW